MLRIGIGTTVALILAVLVATPVVAGEDNDRMQVMEDRLQALEDKLVESESLIGAQREMLAQHELALPAVGQGGGLDAFFSNLEVGGHVTASYIYNFNNPDQNLNQQNTFQFNNDHNSFGVDAIKLELGKSAAEPGTAGFQLDLLLGENNNTLAFGAGSGIPDDSDIFVQEGYVSYNYEGTLLKMGKFETLHGYEVLDSPYNPHVTHSLLFTFAIPLFHTGILASGAMNENLVWAIGGVNGFNNATDFNDNKGVIGRVGIEQDNMSILLNAFVGSEGLRASVTKGLPCAPPGPPFPGDCFGDNNNKTQIYELVASMEVDDNTDIWLDAVYGHQELDSGIVTALGQFIGNPVAGVDEDPTWVAVAAGASMSLNDSTGLALRGEYFLDDGNFRILQGGFVGAGDATHMSLTGTLSRQLTDNLMARLEYRHDWVDGHEGTLDNRFPQNDGGLDDQQDVGIFEVSYSFD